MSDQDERMKLRAAAAKRLAQMSPKEQEGMRKDQLSRVQETDRRWTSPRMHEAKVRSDRHLWDAEDHPREWHADQRAEGRAQDWANVPIENINLTPITSRNEGFLHDTVEHVHLGDDVGNLAREYQNRVYDERGLARERDAAAYARASSGLQPAGKQKYGGYPGRKLTDYELSQIPPEDQQSSFGSKVR